ncbi:MAG: hypothetical protein M0Z61_12465 [Nitrospiraceae bacterium]|nr:hypothetical protein [Nitrospiraceae bacterium]
MDFFQYLNPLRYFTQQEYASFWSHLFETILSGFWARLISVSCFGAAVYFMVRRQNVQLFVILFLLAIAVAYAGGIMGFPG